MNILLAKSMQLALLLIMAVALSACSGRKSTEEDAAQAFTDMREEIQLVITDQSRSQQAVELVSALEQQFSKMGKSQQQSIADLRVLNRNYNATQLEFDMLIARTEATIAEHHAELVRINREFVQLTTSAEWEQLVKSRSKALDAALTNNSQGS